MEFEIDDDPQGLPDQPEGDRDGGLRETLVFRRGSSRRAAAAPRETPIEQMGELA